MSVFFFQKNQSFLAATVPLLKTIVSVLRWRFSSSVFSFCKKKRLLLVEIYVLQVMRPESGFWMPPNWPQIGKMTMTSQFATWRHRQTFLKLFCFFCKFSYWSKLNVNIITGSKVMIIFFHNELTRNLEIGKILVWVFPNIWRLEQLRDTKFGTGISNEILLYAAKGQRYSIYHFWVIKRKQTRVLFCLSSYIIIHI